MLPRSSDKHLAAFTQVVLDFLNETPVLVSKQILGLIEVHSKTNMRSAYASKKASRIATMYQGLFMYTYCKP